MIFGLGNLTYGSRSAIRYASLHSAATSNPATKVQLDGYLTGFQPRFPANTRTTTLTYTSGNAVGSTVTYSSTVIYTIQLPGYTLKNFKLVTSASGVITQ